MRKLTAKQVLLETTSVDVLLLYIKKQMNLTDTIVEIESSREYGDRVIVFDVVVGCYEDGEDDACPAEVVFVFDNDNDEVFTVELLF